MIEAVDRSSRVNQSNQPIPKLERAPVTVVDLARVVVPTGLDHGVEGRGGARGHACWLVGWLDG
jgi:hypothetical protein